MGTIIRPELSKKNKYWVEKNRYYELKYFCLQYPIWKKTYAAIDGLKKQTTNLDVYTKPTTLSDPTAMCVEARSFYFERMEIVEQAAIDADPDLASYILKAVTEGLSYTYLKLSLEIPCGKDTYYDRYRRFFWLLNKTKNYI